MKIQWKTKMQALLLAVVVLGSQPALLAAVAETDSVEVQGDNGGNPFSPGPFDSKSDASKETRKH